MLYYPDATLSAGNYRWRVETWNAGGNGAWSSIMNFSISTTSAPHTLSVSKIGIGGGTISSNPAGINCGSDCPEQYDYNTTVTLTASAATGSIFAGWGGACSGTGTCTISMTAAKSVTASFTSSSRYIAGSGNFVFGESNDIPVVADYNGDGKDDIAVSVLPKANGTLEE